MTGDSSHQDQRWLDLPQLRAESLADGKHFLVLLRRSTCLGAAWDGRRSSQDPQELWLLLCCVSTHLLEDGHLIPAHTILLAAPSS